MLVEGRSARTEFPNKRFNKNALYQPGVTSHSQVCNLEGVSERSKGLIKHQMNLTTGHFVEEDPALFDAPFFSMTPEVCLSRAISTLCRIFLGYNTPETYLIR